MMNKFTYGNTPAAMFLVEHLKMTASPKLIRKVTRTMTDFNAIVNDLEAGNEAGLLSAHTIGALAAALRERAQNTLVGDDLLVRNLVVNILTGRIKDLTRRVQLVRIFEKQQTRVKDVDKLHTKPISDVEDTITHTLLIDRSKRRLKKLSKQDTLY